MAFHHHNNHHSTTTTCCCNHLPPPQQPPQHLLSSSSSSDPFVIATIISQILQSQSPSPLNPTSISTNHTTPFHYSHHFLTSLVHRIDNLESSLLRLSSKNLNNSFSSKNGSFFVKDAAARVIQSYFRVFLVRRSRVLRQIQVLANVKSSLNRIKSKFSDHGFVDFDFLSHSAMDLLTLVDSIQGEDQMIRDSKKSVTREIVQFLELIDEVCVKKHQVMTKKIKTMRLVRNDKARSGHDRGRGYSERAEGSKGRNGDSEKKLIANLRERVERIGKMSRALEEEDVEDDEMEGYEHISDGNGGTFDHDSRRYSERGGGGSKGRNVDNEKKLIANLRERVERMGKMSRALEADEVVDDEIEHIGDGNGGTSDHVRTKYGLINGVNLNKSAPFSDGKKRVCFVEDGKTIRVYNVDGDNIIGAREMEEIEESTKVREEEEEDEDEVEAQSDGQQSTQSSDDVTGSKSYEVDGNHNDDKEFTFPTHEPLKRGERELNFQQGNLV